MPSIVDFSVRLSLSCFLTPPPLIRLCLWDVTWGWQLVRTMKSMPKTQGFCRAFAKNSLVCVKKPIMPVTGIDSCFLLMSLSTVSLWSINGINKASHTCLPNATQLHVELAATWFLCSLSLLLAKHPCLVCFPGIVIKGPIFTFIPVIQEMCKSLVISGTFKLRIGSV